VLMWDGTGLPEISPTRKLADASSLQAADGSHLPLLLAERINRPEQLLDSRVLLCLGNSHCKRLAFVTSAPTGAPSSPPTHAPTPAGCQGSLCPEHTACVESLDASGYVVASCSPGIIGGVMRHASLAEASMVNCDPAGPANDLASFKALPTSTAGGGAMSLCVDIGEEDVGALDRAGALRVLFGWTRPVPGWDNECTGVSASGAAASCEAGGRCTVLLTCNIPPG
jgi:hypothetical protein